MQYDLPESFQTTAAGYWAATFVVQQCSASMPRAIVHALKCEFAMRGAADVASSLVIQAYLASRLGQWAGPAAADGGREPLAANPGVDFLAGTRLRSRARRTFDGRTIELKSRLSRLRALRMA
eukprot:5805527-Pyramimonas_sp.AAC.1